jgi:apolipoprotein D and lipocalin family protein
MRLIMRLIFWRPINRFTRMTSMMRFLPLLLPLLFVGCASAPKAPPLRTVEHVDMDRYLGRWYVIANIPYFLEKGKVASYDTYARKPDGTLVNNFTFRKGSLDASETTWHGSAWVVNTETNAEWKVRFIWPFTSTYLVLELDPDYRWAVVGTPGRGLLWVLARDHQLPDATYAAILERIRAQGYDPAHVVKVPQPAG